MADDNRYRIIKSGLGWTNQSGVGRVRADPGIVEMNSPNRFFLFIDEILYFAVHASGMDSNDWHSLVDGHEFSGASIRIDLGGRSGFIFTTIHILHASRIQQERQVRVIRY